MENMENTCFMENSSFLKKTKRLTQFLILSLSLNIGLVIAFAFKAIAMTKGDENTTLVKQAPFVTHLETTRDVLERYAHFSFYQLVDELFDKTHVEHGFRKRDFALACLVNFHSFDLERCLPAIQIQKRKMFLVDPINKARKIEIYLFPGLNDTHFKAMMNFIKNEKWPLTAEGLFMELKKGGVIEDSLYETFFQLDELRILFNLFERFHCQMTKKEFIDMICEGQWSFIERFYRSQMLSLDLSLPVFEGVLRYYFSVHSVALAHKIIEWGREDWIKRMEDHELIAFMQLLKKPSAQVETFLRQMLISIRSDDVRKLAALKLFEMTGEKVIEPLDGASFTSHRSADSVEKPSSGDIGVEMKIASLRHHIVKSGESLWAIAKQYHVDVDEIVNLNHLSSRNHLSVGQKLVIPNAR